MDGFANAAEAMACPHCGVEIRRGMIRCRDCGQSIVETDEDFALNGAQLVESQGPKCALCGAVLEPGSDDCAACTSALLDQLLKGPERSEPVAGAQSSTSSPSSGAAKLRVRKASPAAARANPDGGQSTSKLREFTPRAPLPETPKTKPTAGSPQPAARKKGPAPSAAAPAAPAAPSPVATPAPAAAAPEEEESESTTTTVETSAACTALLASLGKADPALRCEIATALGKLGDQGAVAPLERHLTDQDIRVRRAVAGALVQLGHPKGKALLDIAERTPAKSMLMMAQPIPKSKPRYSGGGSSIDPDMLKKVGGALVVIGAIGGGIWYWMNMKPTKAKKPKPAVKKVVTPAAPATPVSE
jgi:HEAT repeats